MKKSKKIARGLVAFAALGALFLFVTIVMLGGLSGPVGAGGFLIIGGIYLAIGIAILMVAIYLATVSEIARYVVGVLVVLAIGSAMFKGFQDRRDNTKYDYSQGAINQEKICSEVAYACLSYPAPEWRDALLASQPAPSGDIRAYTKVAAALELFYPGFWQDTPQSERLDWVMQAELVRNKFDPSYRSTTRRLLIMAAICAVIGLDFEEKAVHAPTVEFMNSLNEGGNGSNRQILDYLLFSHLERDYDLSGNHYNSWTIRGRFTTFVEWPQRPVPNFDDVLEADYYRQDQDRWKIFKETIENSDL